MVGVILVFKINIRSVEYTIIKMVATISIEEDLLKSMLNNKSYNIINPTLRKKSVPKYKTEIT